LGYQNICTKETYKTYMKQLTFYCLSCRRDTTLEHPPVQCAHCGSQDGLIYRWRGRSWRPQKAAPSAGAA
jgi:Zn finger protein HypA/HybF involved in hydrogenase expression